MYRDIDADLSHKGGIYNDHIKRFSELFLLNYTRLFKAKTKAYEVHHNKVQKRSMNRTNSITYLLIQPSPVECHGYSSIINMAAH